MAHGKKMAAVRHAGAAAAFRKKIYALAARHGRDFPWRKTRNPYYILVSEIMLQQTQTVRVEEKYRAFIRAFPTVGALARASQHAVLAAWSGLGYNRRALLLQRAARDIVALHGGRVPRSRAALESLPGVGPYTAGAVMAFAFNLPGVFIDTNIRSVFIHYFFPHSRRVTDRTLMPLLEVMEDHKNPRRWYNALMDAGAYLKQTGNPARQSAHYTRQSRFEGSLRQIRGRILATLVARGPRTIRALGASPEILRAIASLIQDGFIARHGRLVQVAEKRRV